MMQVEWSPPKSPKVKKEKWFHTISPQWKYSSAKGPPWARGPGGMRRNRSLLQSGTSYQEQSAIPGVELFSRLVKGKGKAASGLQYLAFSTQFNAVWSMVKAKPPQPREDSWRWNAAGTPYDGRLLITKSLSCLSEQLHSGTEELTEELEKKSSIDKTWNPSPDANFSCLWVQLALGSSSSQKDAVQRGEDIPKAQGLSNFSFCWWASLTKRYSVEISVLMDHRHLIPSARVIIPGYQDSQTPRKSTRVGGKKSPKRFEFHLMLSRHINGKEGLSTYREYLIMYWYC